jgi:hypothetical protein
MRTRTLLLLATTLTVTTIAVAVAAGGAVPSSSAPSERSRAERPLAGALRASPILRAWDHRRAAAWARGDAAALAGLYTSGSGTGAHDVGDLRRWRSRGLRVVGLVQQVAELRVLVETSRRLVLTVTERTLDGVAVGHHRRTALPRSAWSRHRIRLRRAHGQWLVEEVVDQPAR